MEDSNSVINDFDKKILHFQKIIEEMTKYNFNEIYPEINGESSLTLRFYLTYYIRPRYWTMNGIPHKLTKDLIRCQFSRLGNDFFVEIFGGMKYSSFELQYEEFFQFIDYLRKWGKIEEGKKISYFAF